MTDRPLYRQIHPSWIRNGGVTSMAFLPTSKDRKRLSVYDGDMIAAKSAWMHYSNTLGNKSAGVMAVTETECRPRNLSITPDPEQYAEHALTDFGILAQRVVKEVACCLAKAARTRGRSCRPDGDSVPA